MFSSEKKLGHPKNLYNQLILTYNELRAFEHSKFIHCIELRFYVL